MAAYDVYGKRITGLSQTVTSPPLTADQYQQFMQKPFQLFQQVDLPPGETFLRVGVLDSVSDKVGTLEIPLTVPRKLARPAGAPGGKGGSLSPSLQAAGGCEDFSCKSLQPRRIMPLIFGNHFRWEISQEINWRIGRNAARSAGLQMYLSRIR